MQYSLYVFEILTNHLIFFQISLRIRAELHDNISNVKVILNGRTNQIHWPEQNATAQFIPPLITMVEVELDQIISKISE